VGFLHEYLGVVKKGANWQIGKGANGQMGKGQMGKGQIGKCARGCLFVF
jgi:hypothetical protein